ncbi:helix-turn-helix transcriptional regulator [Streptomyces virginiae]|uniref:helix-turn-helix domain-containing protein n=1 Tax=Streptomyces virginiae TaxID=1961 RepID=UPI00343FF28E
MQNKTTPASTTEASTVREYGIPDSITHSAAVDSRRLLAGFLRSEVALVSGDIVDLHNEATEHDLRARAAIKAKRGVASLLRELAVERGMAWADIAKLAGVSVSAVRKWRTGGDASAEKRHTLARLAAFLDLLTESAVEDPVQWLEVPLALPDGYSIRPMELYADGHLIPILEIAGLRREPSSVLDEILPDWRKTHRSSYEVFTASDGSLAFREHEDR